MNKLKSLLVVVALCFVGLTSYGQTELSEQATKLTTSIDKQVDLNQTQFDQVYKIQMDYLTAVSKLNTSNLANGRFYAQRKALNVQRVKSMRSVLTASQNAALGRAKK